MLYTDFDPFVCAVTRRNVNLGRLAQGDVWERDVRELRATDLVGYQQVHLFCGIAGIPLGLQRAGIPADFNIWTGGFPCQDVSVAGKGAGIAKGTRSGLWRELFRLVRNCRPAWLLLENVPALKNRGYDWVYDALARIGYAVTSVVVGAEHVRFPHKRHRVWIIANYKGGRNRGGVANTISDAIRKQWGCAGRSGQAASPVTGRRGSTYELSDADGLGRTSQGDRRIQEYADACIHGQERPSRPGEPQHGWEHPRLIDFNAGLANAVQRVGLGRPRGVGRGSACAAEVDRDTVGGREGGEPEWGVGSPVDGLSTRLVRAARRHNRNTLKAAGNAVIPAVVELIGRAILEVA